MFMQFCVSLLHNADVCRFNLYKIEQELGTEIQPIPAQIDKKLYVYDSPETIPRPPSSNQATQRNANAASDFSSPSDNAQNSASGSSHHNSGRHQYRPRGQSDYHNNQGSYGDNDGQGRGQNRHGHHPRRGGHQSQAPRNGFENNDK